MTDVPPFVPTPGCQCPACAGQLPPPELTGERLITKLKAILADAVHKGQHSLELLSWVNASLAYGPLPGPVERAMLQWGVDRYNADRELYVAVMGALALADPSLPERLRGAPTLLTLDAAMAELALTRDRVIRLAAERGGVIA